MAVEYTVRDRYMSGNPVVVSASGLNAGAYLNYRLLTASDILLFEGVAFSLSGNVRLDLSSFFTTIREEDVKRYKIQFSTGGTADQEKTFRVYAGAINNLLKRKLYEQNTDIFAAKLHPSDKNFLLSTRSFGRYLFITENELLPLKYYKQYKKFGLFSGPTLLASYDHSGDTEDSVGTIDIQSIRKAKFDSTGILSNVFDIIPTGSTTITTTIVITEAREARHYIKFRNSLYAWEKISIDDVVNCEVEIEATNIHGYDEAVNNYITVNQEKKMTSRYKASITSKNNSELLWITDMLLSKEVIFIADGYEYPVMVQSGTPIVQSTDNLPKTVELEIIPIDTDGAFSPTNTDTRSNPGIFNENFNNIFY